MYCYFSLIHATEWGFNIFLSSQTLQTRNISTFFHLMLAAVGFFFFFVFQSVNYDIRNVVDSKFVIHITYTNMRTSRDNFYRWFTPIYLADLWIFDADLYCHWNKNLPKSTHFFEIILLKNQQNWLILGSVHCAIRYVCRIAPSISIIRFSDIYDF